MIDVSFSVCSACSEFIEAGHSCNLVSAARAFVARIRSIDLRAWADAWIDFCLGAGARPALVAGARRLELKIAAIAGLVDPNGFLVGADLVRCKRKGPRRAPKGPMPEALARDLIERGFCWLQP